MLPRKSFENLHSGEAVIVLFEQILFKFFVPNFECCTKYNAFCSYIFDYDCLLGRKAYCYRKGSKLWFKKLYASKTCLKMAGGGDASPTSPRARPGGELFLANVPKY